jgi:hypothetical protein
MRASTVVLTSVAAAAVASALWSGMRLSEERARVDTLSTQLEMLRHLRGTRPMQSEPETPAPTPTSEPQSAPALAAPANVTAQLEAVADTPPPGARAREPGESRRRLMSHPEYRKLIAAQQRLTMEQRFRDLPRALGLSADQANQMFDLITEQTMASQEGGFRRVNSQEEMQALSRANAERQQAYEAKMTALLGESGMAKYADYRESMQSRSEVRMLGNELIGSSDPLREDQMEPLLNVMYTEQKRLNQEWSELAASGQDGARLSAKRTRAAIAANERIVEASRSLLSGPQLTALKDMYRRQKAQMELQEEMSRFTSRPTPKNAPRRTD